MERRHIKLIYFSGTGGTAMAANCLAEAFNITGTPVTISRIGKQNSDEESTIQIDDAFDFLIVMYPVYAFDAPIPVYEWLDSLPDGKGFPFAIISVSGGGEIAANRASRIGCTKILERKGYEVTYEAMLVMPSNIFIATPEPYASELLKVLPEKVKQIAADIQKGKRLRTKKPRGTIFYRMIGKAEQMGSGHFGKSLFADERCIGCGRCVSSCSRGNIVMQNDKMPSFGKRCVVCLACVYGCPQKAIASSKYGFSLIRNGYQLPSQGISTTAVTKDTKLGLWNALLFIGVTRYLKGQ